MKYRKHIFASLMTAVMLGGMSAIAAPSSTVTLTTPLDSQNATTSESTLGDLTADAVLASAGSAQFALVPASETSPDTIPAGNIPIDKIVQNLKSHSDPTDTVVSVHLSGENVIEALNHGVSRLPGPFDGFLQVSGLTVVYRLSSDGQTRADSAKITSSGAAIDPSGKYTVAMPRYLADGALGYFAIWPSNFDVKDTGVNIATAVTTYASAHQPLSYQTGRISGE